MASRRTKSISGKLTEAEHRRVAAQAGDLTLSEWVRTVVLKAAAPPTSEDSTLVLVLAELLALRAILLNLSFATSRGEPLTAEAMQQLIAHADADKLHQAHHRISDTTARRTM